MKENWIRFEEFLNITGLSAEQAKKMITSNQINAKYLNDTLYVGRSGKLRSTHSASMSSIKRIHGADSSAVSKISKKPLLISV